MFNNFNSKLFYLSLAVIVLLEALSFGGYFSLLLTNIVAIVILLGTVLLSYKKAAYGFIILLTELIIGSQGYLFWIGNGEQKISLRIGLWIIVMGSWLIRELVILIQSKKLSAELKSFTYYRPLLVLWGVIILAGIIGYFSGNDSAMIYDEAKRWLYSLAIVPAVIVFQNKADRQLLWSVVSAAVIWIALKTALLVYIFSHPIPGSAAIYMWLRENLLGEVTPLGNGFSRVFLQSQIFAIPAFLVTLVLYMQKKKVIFGLAAAIFFATIATSLSRSFWLGAALAWLICIIFVIKELKPNLKSLTIMAVQNIGVLILGVFFLFAAAEFPIPKPLGDIDASLFSDRATQFEAAAASRWNLLPVMREAIKERPLSGYGLGKELSYITKDPRVLEHSPDGRYTTNAFEWGWLDIWLKLGMLGVVAYIYLLLTMSKEFFIKKHELIRYAGFTSLLALIIVHAFTPYLNHPLGFGYLALLLLLTVELD